MKALPMGHMLAVQLLTCMQQGAEPHSLTRCRHHLCWGQCRVYNTVVLSIHPLLRWVMAEQPQGLCTPLSHSAKAHPQSSWCTRRFDSSWTAPVKDEPQGWQPESKAWFLQKLTVCGSSLVRGMFCLVPNCFVVCTRHKAWVSKSQTQWQRKACCFWNEPWSLSQEFLWGHQHNGGTVRSTTGTQAGLSLLMTSHNRKKSCSFHIGSIREKNIHWESGISPLLCRT